MLFDVRFSDGEDDAMRKFDTKVQHLKYKVLREVAREEWNGTLTEHLLDIPQTIVPGKQPTMRCCVYKERAILGERVKLAIGGDRRDPNVIQVIDIACDGCPMGGYEVTNSCRGCLAHRCEDVCKRGAITFERNHEAKIDKDKCINCGKCAEVCPFSAIINRKRPCENACKVGAISPNADKAASVVSEKCTSCGACVYQCPFGAISDKSYILDVIRLLKADQPVYAVVAPTIAAQFTYAKLGQVVAGLHELGFTRVVEAALGADMVAFAESGELAEKGFLISSCCPAFVSYVKKQFPSLVPHISQNLSPMATVAKALREKHPEAHIVFIGPCTAKKEEVQQQTVRPYVDAAMTFEELQALFDSRDLDITLLDEKPLFDASGYGRGFARCGGLAEAVAEGLKEHGRGDFQLKAISCNGLAECRTALLKAEKGVLDANFIEGMACVGGCVGGAGCLTHRPQTVIDIDRYSRASRTETMRDAIDGLE